MGAKELLVRIAGNYTFDATREEVWSAINDPEVLARTIPGCQRLDQVGENEYESTLKVGLQAVRGTYNGKVKIDNVVAPESYSIHVDGKGSNGFLKGTGGLKLREEGAQTILDYGGEAQVGGTIASVGQRLLDGAAKTLINQSLKALAAQIEARRTVASEAAPSKESTAEFEGPTGSSEVTASTPPTPVESTAEFEGPTESAAPVNETVASALIAPAEGLVPPQPAAAPAAPTFERRSIVVPEGQGLSDADVAKGVVEDFLKERPWFPWVVAAFLLGFLFGRRK
jgi:uncharacterized protein